jgi:hypothetical protein
LGEYAQSGQERRQVLAQAFDQIAAFLDQHRRQAQCRDLTSDSGETGCSDAEVGRRVALLGVEPDGDDQRRGLLCGNCVQSLPYRRAERVVSGAWGQWQIQVPAETGTVTRFVGVTSEPGVQTGGIAVDRYVMDVVALIEDLLRAVAVVDVEIEDRDPAAAAAMAALFR